MPGSVLVSHSANSYRSMNFGLDFEILFYTMKNMRFLEMCSSSVIPKDVVSWTYKYVKLGLQISTNTLKYICCFFFCLGLKNNLFVLKRSENLFIYWFPKLHECTGFSCAKIKLVSTAKKLTPPWYNTPVTPWFLPPLMLRATLVMI